MSIKIENTQVFGWEGTIRGARNPMNSWEKSDSLWFDGEEYYDICGNSGPTPKESNGTGLDVGYSDHKLLMNLCKGGTEEAKWRRMIHVQMDVTAPLYWWKEFETYKVGTVSNSCSTMHKIHAKEFTLDDFSCEHLLDQEDLKDPSGGIPMTEVVIYDAGREDYGYVEDDPRYEDEYYGDPGILTWPKQILKITIAGLNFYREKFLETKDKKYWWQMIQLLPSSYNQRRTIDLNYEVLASQYRQRKEHKLDEWRQYCDWIKTLPYSEFITVEQKPLNANEKAEHYEKAIDAVRTYHPMEETDA